MFKCNSCLIQFSRGLMTYTGDPNAAGAGHWVTFIHHNDQWWKVDSNSVNVIIEHPFVTQFNPLTCVNGHTIEYMALK